MPSFYSSDTSVYRIGSILTATLLTAMAAAPASAALIEAWLTFDAEYQQTGPTTVVPFNGGTNNFFSANGAVDNFNDFNLINVQIPTSPTTVDPLSTRRMVTLEDGSTHPTYTFQTGFLTSAQIGTQFPTGKYTITAANTNTGAQVAVPINYAGSHFANVPTLTAATFNALNGLDPSKPFTFQFLPFTPDPTISEAFEFLAVQQSNGTVAFSESFLGEAVNSITVPAGTFLPNTAYMDELIFSPRNPVETGSSVSCTASGTTCPGRVEIQFNTRTMTDFTTGGPAAVPAPPGLLVFLPIGGVLFGAKLLERAKKRRSGKAAFRSYAT